MLARASHQPLPVTKLHDPHAARSFVDQCKQLRLRVRKPQREPRPGVRQCSSGQASTHVGTQAVTRDDAGPAEELFEVTVRKPLGLVLVEGAGGAVVVEEVVPGGNADQLSDKIRAGDQLVACSATVLKAGKEGEYEREGYGRRPYDSFERIMFPTAGQDFGDVMKAISSNSARWGITEVTLQLKRVA